MQNSKSLLLTVQPLGGFNKPLTYFASKEVTKKNQNWIFGSDSAGKPKSFRNRMVF